MAPDPYSSVPEPLTTSIRSARNGSTVMLWSEPLDETSIDDVWFSSTNTRVPVRPWITGWPTAGPKDAECTPGVSARVPPMD